MATEMERLVVQLSADVRRLEKSMDRSTAIVKRETKKMEAETGRLSMKIASDFEKMGAGITRGLGALGIGASVSIGGVVAALRNASSALARVRADALQAGLASETFQQLEYAARQSQISVDGLVDGMKELQLRADEFVQTGSGSAKEAFERLGMSQREVQERLKDPADLLQEILKRIHELDKAAQIRILDEMLGGTAGEQFIRFLDGGVERLGQLRKEAEDVGYVLSDDLLKDAEKINAEFEKITALLERRMKGAIVGVAAATSDWLSQLQTKLSEIGNSDVWMRIANMLPYDPLAPQVTRLGQTGASGSWAPTGASGTYGSTNFPGGAPVTPREKPDVSALRQARKEEERARQRAAEEAAREAEQIQRVIDNLRFEQEQLQRGELDRQIYNELRAAGVTLASEDGQEIAKLVTGNYSLAKAQDAAAEAQRKLNEQMEVFKSMAADALSGFISDIRSGENALVALQRALDRVLEQVMQMATNRIVSQLFGGIGGSITANAHGNAYVGGRVQPFARGGVVKGPTVFPMARGAGLMGEAGHEAVMPLARLSNGDLGVKVGGRGGSPEMRVIINNAPPHQREERQNETGGTDVVINFLKGEVAKDMASPKTVIGRSLQSMGGWPLMNKR